MRSGRGVKETTWFVENLWVPQGRSVKCRMQFGQMTQFKRLLVLVFLGCCFSVAAQTNEGWRVVEATNAGKAGQPLPGVTIRYGCDSRDSETQGLMASDVNGNFDNVLALTECPSTCWASFSFVGYEPRQLSCSDMRGMGVVVLTSQTEAWMPSW